MNNILRRSRLGGAPPPGLGEAAREPEAGGGGFPPVTPRGGGAASLAAVRLLSRVPSSRAAGRSSLADAEPLDVAKVEYASLPIGALTRWVVEVISSSNSTVNSYS